MDKAVVYRYEFQGEKWELGDFSAGLRLGKCTKATGLLGLEHQLPVPSISEKS